jgi:hypothetical protein
LSVLDSQKRYGRPRRARVELGAMANRYCGLRLVHLDHAPVLRRGSSLSQGSAAGTIEGDWPSSVQIWSTCFLRLAGSSTSVLMRSRNRSPISWQMAWLCIWSILIGLLMAEPSFR